MDLLGIPVWYACLTVFMASLVWYAWTMSKDLNIFDRLGVTGPPPFPFVGNLGVRYWMEGMFKSQVKLYQRYKDRKLYGSFDANTPVLHIRDCDMIKDVLVTHFDHFVDRPSRFAGDPLIDKSTHFLKTDQWRKTRESVSSTLNEQTLNWATSVMQRTCDALMNYLKPKIDWRRKVDLSCLALLYSIDVQSGVTFGDNYKTFQNVYSKNVDNLERLLKKSIRWRYSSVFFPFMPTILRLFRVNVVPKSALRYFNREVSYAIEEYEMEEEESESSQCFLGSLAKRKSEPGLFADGKEGLNSNNNRKGKDDPSRVVMELSKSEIQAQAFTFVHSGLEKVSHILSMTLLQLANNPTACERVQQEIDQRIGSQTPDENNTQTLHYLDQCINETIRMFPPYIAIERICTEDIKIQGIHIPKNMIVRIPVYALHHDPNVWTDPDKFRPERFSKSHIALRHPYAFLPFGMGPRKCLGMRLAMLELKMALVYMLRIMTPIPCGQSVYPIKLKKWSMEPQDELWVKVRPRFWLGVCEYPPSSILS